MGLTGRPGPMVSDWQVWDQWGGEHWVALCFVPSWEPVQTGGLLELFHPIVGACVGGMAVYKVT